MVIMNDTTSDTTFDTTFDDIPTPPGGWKEEAKEEGEGEEEEEEEEESCFVSCSIVPKRAEASTMTALRRGGSYSVIGEFAAWIRQRTISQSSSPPVAIIRGPHGCGKSEVVRTVARSLGWKLCQFDASALESIKVAGYVGASWALRARCIDNKRTLFVIDDANANSNGQIDTSTIIITAVRELIANIGISVIVVLSGEAIVDNLSARIVGQMGETVATAFNLCRPLSVILSAARRASPSTDTMTLLRLAEAAKGDIRWAILNAPTATSVLQRQNKQMVSNVSVSVLTLHKASKVLDIFAFASDIRGICSSRSARIRNTIQTLCAATMAATASVSRKRQRGGGGGGGGSGPTEYPLPSTARTADAQKKRIGTHVSMRLPGVGTSCSASDCARASCVALANSWLRNGNGPCDVSESLLRMIGCKDASVMHAIVAELTSTWPRNAKTSRARLTMTKDLLAAIR